MPINKLVFLLFADIWASLQEGNESKEKARQEEEIVGDVAKAVLYNSLAL